MASDIDRFGLDSRRVRQAFERAAAGYDAAAVLQREIEQRMAERLALVKLNPETILDAGCGTGSALGELAGRYPDAFLIGFDLSYAMLGAARRRAERPTAPEPSLLARLLGKRAERPALVCADACRLPFATASIGLLWSNLVMDWINDVTTAFVEFHRVLQVGGLLMFTTFGPDTLKELRAAAGAARVHAFSDMHDLGDLLIAAGYSAPVVDMELVRIAYAAGARLLDDLRASGQTNARADRPRGLAGRGLLKAFRAAPLSATYEVVYGHAWRRAEAEPAVKTVRVFKRFS